MELMTEKTFRDLMQYSFSLTEETLYWNGYSIQIQRDSDVSNPYEDWDVSNPYEDCDGMSPAIWMSCDRHSSFSEYGNADLESVFSRYSDYQISRHWRAICKAMDLHVEQSDMEMREKFRDYYGKGESLTHARRDYFIDALQDARSESWGRGIDYLNTLRALYRLIGIPAETFQRNGYCQGDSVYGLIVMTPEFVEKMGIPHAKPKAIDWAACEKDMGGDADIYGAWCFGDCYGYSISFHAEYLESPDDWEDSPPNHNWGEDVDSCWGFIGDDPEKNGMFDHLIPALNHDIQSRAEIAAQEIAEAMVEARPDLAPQWSESV